MITEITAQRKRIILATNTASLLSVLFSGKGVISETTLLAGLFRAFQDQLPSFGFEKQYREWIVPELSLVGFAKSTDRSVRGSMNDFIEQIKSWFDDGIFDLRKIAYGFNRSPTTTIKMESPLTVFPKLTSLPDR